MKNCENCEKLEEMLGEEQIFRNRFMLHSETYIQMFEEGALCIGCASGSGPDCLVCGIYQLYQSFGEVNKDIGEYFKEVQNE